ncbi:MAG: response regulator [Planctomycetota bacterium]
MQANAVFFGSGNGSATSLQTFMDRCRADQFEIKTCPSLPDTQNMGESLPAGPAVVFIPAVEEDCLGIKLGQIAGNTDQPRVVCLYADSMPSPEYLCLAFREGVDDVIALDRIPERMELYITRARKLLASRMQQSAGQDGADEAIAAENETLKRRLAKAQERLLALASAAQRLARGELNLARTAEKVLIVSASASQSAAAGQIARELGFIVSAAASGADALADVAQSPPRVVLVDGTLEDTDAAKLARQIRKQMGSEPVVICAWSSNPQTEDTVLVPGSGIDDFVPKSTTGQGQMQLVAALLGSLR